MNIDIKALREILQERIKTQERPEFFPFEKEGDYVIGRIEYTYETNFGRENEEPVEVFVIRALDPNVFADNYYSLPNNVSLRNALERNEVKVGDFVLVTYKGETKTKSKYTAKIFLVAKISAEEAAQLGILKEETEETIEETKPKKKKAKPKVKKAKEEEKKEEAPEEEKEAEEIPEEELEKAKTFLRDILDFFGEASIPELEKSFKSIGIEVDINKLIEECDFVILENNKVKLKE